MNRLVIMTASIEYQNADLSGEILNLTDQQHHIKDLNEEEYEYLITAIKRKRNASSTNENEEDSNGKRIHKSLKDNPRKINTHSYRLF